MKKNLLLLLLLLPFAALTGFAQESRQDVSLSVSGLFPPFVNGGSVLLTGHNGMGGLASYRYMLTPRSAVEGNYQYAQNANNYYTTALNYRIHTRLQEISVGYVYTIPYKNWNPFVEVGIGSWIFSPLKPGTTTLDGKRSTQIGALYGGGIAYEISPSFDIRAEYRGIFIKAPSFGIDALRTNKYTNLNNPVVGVAYHF